MSLTSHLEKLRNKHEQLSRAVEAAHRSPGVENLEISRMKKEKLAVKEEISRLATS